MIQKSGNGALANRGDGEPVRTHAKILATLGPASSSETVIRGLLHAGVNALRFNFSHGTHASHRKLFETARRCIADVGRPVGLVQDLQGPKIRVGSLENGRLFLTEGEEVCVTAASIQGMGNRFQVSYSGLSRDARPGDAILLDDGNLRLEVTKIEGEWVCCRVMEGGVLLENKGANLPDTRTSLPPLTDKDLRDLELGLDLGFDYVALSFVQTAKDVELLREKMIRLGRCLPIIAKLERPAVLDDLDNIIRSADMIMVARGDLGIELEVERVPVLQKIIIRKANGLGTPVITATQMLESMIERQIPTRAETTDVANAVYDGTDALMLSGETSVGRRPVRVVEMMKRIVANAEHFKEGYSAFSTLPDIDNETVPKAICRLAARAGNNLPLKAVWVYTQTGNTARFVSKFKPPLDIYAFSPVEDVIRRMTLLWGVHPLLSPRFDVTESCIRYMNDFSLERGLAKEGDLVAITMGSPIPQENPTNLLKLHTVHRM